MESQPLVMTSGGRTRTTACILGTVFVLLLGCEHRAGAQGADPSPPTLTKRVRRPMALAIGQDSGSQRLLVANRGSGSITLIDTAARRVVAEYDVGLGLADLAALPDGAHFLAVDQAGHDLLLLRLRSHLLTVLARVRVSPDPVRVSVSKDGRGCVVASRWSRRLTFLELSESAGLGTPSVKIIRTLELPFIPGELVRPVDGSALIVADAFGGRLGLVNPGEGTLERVRQLPGHNLRGMAVEPGGTHLLIAHQSLSPLARSDFDDVHWGTLLGNRLQAIPWTTLLHGSPGSASGARSLELGDVGRGAADPCGLIVDPQGRIIVALAGVNEVAILDGFRGRPRRVEVGRRPVALAASRDGKEVYSADAFDDTISVVETEPGRRVATIAMGQRPEPSLIDRGEQLFHDGRLSHDGWMSCQSCHADGHTSGLLADTLGDGSYGAPKRIPSLLGVGTTGPWNWTGSASRLEDQVRKSILTTMQGQKTKLTDQNVAALTAYLRSLSPIEEPHPETPETARGREVFQSRRCGACHAAPDYTSPELFDVGLVDEAGNRRFNPPSLRGVGLREPLLHDGRAMTLKDLFTQHKHPSGVAMPAEAINDLVAFLKTL